MITSLIIDGVATYAGSRQEIVGLAEFNYFYGPNGSGKTTISRVIDGSCRNGACQLTWLGGAALETLVYNRDFVERVFTEADDLPGIFSLGQKSAQLLLDIEEAKTKIAGLADELTRLQKTLSGEDGEGGKLGELASAKITLRDACWTKKENLGSECREAFRGFLNDKSKFVDEVLKQLGENKAKLRTKDYLQERGATVFGDPPQSVLPLPELTYNDLVSLDTGILAKKVVGKEDVDIAALIQKLGNSDWVKQGREYIANSGEKCPFCQQAVPTNLESSLDEYFDETYARDIAAIEDLRASHDQAATNVIAAIDGLLTNPPDQLDADALKAKRDTIDAKLATNRARIAQKNKEPSAVVSLEPVSSLLNQAAALVVTANDAIVQHNTLVRGLTKAKKALKAECWRYLLDTELKRELATFGQTTEAAQKAVTSLQEKIAAKRTEINKTQTYLEELQRQTTSIEPAINAINGVLRSFGFDGFSLAQADTPHCYKLVRADGTDAMATLSEGERSFITFLYFFNLLEGSLEESGVTNDRVVVFDDPVSSLDSDILFIVSTLIKRLQRDLLKGTSRVKQLFVLTHNVYFHKEVTFDSPRHAIGLNKKTFWTIRKYNGRSEVTHHIQNPITTGYNLLWSELREQSRNTVATQNAMRRILEHYFKILGGRDPIDLCEEFEGADQLTCRSLMSWINDGSHTASDDLYLSVDQETIENYRRVFRMIFEKTNHIGHYDMMMGTPPTPFDQQTTEQAQPVVSNEAPAPSA